MPGKRRRRPCGVGGDAVGLPARDAARASDCPGVRELQRPRTCCRGLAHSTLRAPWGVQALRWAKAGVSAGRSTPKPEGVGLRLVLSWPLPATRLLCSHLASTCSSPLLGLQGLLPRRQMHDRPVVGRTLADVTATTCCTSVRPSFLTLTNLAALPPMGPEGAAADAARARQAWPAGAPPHCSSSCAASAAARRMLTRWKDELLTCSYISHWPPACRGSWWRSEAGWLGGTQECVSYMKAQVEHYRHLA
jgi:hypothetical protein